MSEKENIIIKFIHFLRKIHFFAMGFAALWSAAIIGGALFQAHAYYIIEIPEPVVALGVIVVAAVGVYVQYRWMFKPQDKKMLWIYIGWNYIFPALVCGVNVVFGDQLMSSDGGDMFSGLSYLGLVLGYIMLFAVSALGCVVFFLSRFIRKKWREHHEEGESKGWQVVVDVFNVLLVLAMVFTGLGFGIIYGAEAGRNYMSRRELADNDEFRSEILNHGKMTEDQIMSEGFYYAQAVEVMAERPEVISTEISPEHQTNISSDVLHRGIENYNQVKSKYTISRGVEMINQGIYYDAKERAISVTSQMEVIDEAAREIFNYYAIVVFDEKWNVTDIHYQKNPVNVKEGL